MIRGVRAAAVTLLGAPSDLGAWLDLGDLLEAAGMRPRAARAFQGLGEAAGALGSVGLATACARWLRVHGHEAAAEALTDQIARAHCKGSRSVSTGLTAIPPLAPPVDAAAGAEVPADPGAAADQALAAAVLAARGRAPRILPPTPMVRALEPADFRTLVAEMTDRRVAAGEVVVDVGQPALALFWIARGSVEVSRGVHRLGELFANAFFGEIALLDGSTRTARVTAREPTWLLELPADVIERVAGRAPRLASVLAGHARARLLAGVMRSSELFARLDDDARAALLPRFDTEQVEPGTAILRAGAANDRLYVVVSGRCEVREGDAVVAVLRSGDGIGEVSLLGRKPATADVVAVERTIVLSLARPAFDEIAVAHPALLAEVYRLLVEREREHADVVHDASDLVL